MSIVKNLVHLVPLIFLMLPSRAESRFCIGGNVTQMSQGQIEICRQQLQHMRLIVRRQNAPDWHYVLVCDEQGWKDYAIFSSTDAKLLQQATTDTDMIQHTTFVRASRLNTTLDQVFSAEVASIVRQSSILLASNR
ncbi:MAG: hypothetical protein JSS87_11685 [Acidobacteria bacterium]|nr:hypothetical protein [Acidobacteriota bacterium]